MTYVYREASRMASRPVHVPAPPPPEPEPSTPPAPPSAPRKPPALPPPIWGGQFGLKLATHEAIDWERRHPHHKYTKESSQP